MNNTYTVSLFGHVNISDITQVADALSRVIRKLLLKKEYVQFLVGRDSDFDYIAAAAVRRVREESGCRNCSLVLVLPYMTEEYYCNKENYHYYYDKIRICGKSKIVNFKSAYEVCSRRMIRCSDLVVCCIRHQSGRAYRSVKYAEKKKVKICNVWKQIRAKDIHS